MLIQPYDVKGYHILYDGVKNLTKYLVSYFQKFFYCLSNILENASQKGEVSEVLKFKNNIDTTFDVIH